jgi:hypothetical protein
MVINAVDVARQSRLGTGLNLEQRCGQIWWARRQGAAAKDWRAVGRDARQELFSGTATPTTCTEEARTGKINRRRLLGFWNRRQ